MHVKDNLPIINPALHTVRSLFGIKAFLCILLLTSSINSIQAQEWTSHSPLLNLKFTPTALFNPNVATLMTGVEIWPVKKLNAQFEYGHQVSFFPKAFGAFYREDWYYRKYKFGLRYHYFPMNWQQRPFPFRGLLMSMLNIPTEERRNFVGLDFMSTPQSYLHENGSVLMEDGSAFSYAQSKINRDAWTIALVVGNQMRLDDKFFIEMYFGFGVKWVDVQHDLAQGGTMAIAPLAVGELGINGNSQEGIHGFPYIDIGIKIGLEVLHR